MAHLSLIVTTDGQASVGGALLGCGFFCFPSWNVGFLSWPSCCGQNSIQRPLYPSPARNSDMASVFWLALRTVPIGSPPAMPCLLSNYWFSRFRQTSQTAAETVRNSVTTLKRSNSSNSKKAKNCDTLVQSLESSFVRVFVFFVSCFYWLVFGSFLEIQNIKHCTP